MKLLYPTRPFFRPPPVAVLLLLATVAFAESPSVLGPAEHGVAPPDQVRRYLLGEVRAAQVRWQQDYERRTDPAAIRDHYLRLRQRFIAALGGLPERTPLNARTTGVLEAAGFRVEKVIFESRPQFFVTASLHLPDPARFPAPWPGVLVPCGHYLPAKAHDEYQSMGALLALNGMAALVFDPIEQGERLQAVDPEGRSRFWGTNAHTLDDIQSIPLGQGIARQFVWDGMRAIDYLQSRPEIDPERIGVTGNSGGGTQTSQILALDERVKAAAPSCFISHLASQLANSIGDGEQHVFGQQAFGFDHADYLLMQAPTPVKLLAATHDFFEIEATWETFRYAKRVFTRLGRSEAVDILENDAGHNYYRTQREAAARWLALWLRSENREIREPELKLFTEEELRCTPRGQVMLLPGARSLRDLLREDADRISAQRAQTWARLNDEDRRNTVRRLANFRELNAIPTARWEQVRTDAATGYRIEAHRVEVEGGAIAIPALWLEPAAPSADPPVVFASEEGLGAESGPDGALDRLAKAGRRVLAVDLRGLGETKQNAQEGMTAAVGRDYWDFYAAYSLGRTFVGMRAEDLLIAVREAQSRSGSSQVDVIAVGAAGVPALHAAFCEPAAVRKLTLDGTLSSWDAVVRANSTFGQLMNVVFGALTTYDLPDLVHALGNAADVRSPAGPTGLTPGQLALSPDDHLPTRQGLTGIRFGSPKFINVQAVDGISSGENRWDVSRGRDWSARWSGFLVPSVTGRFAFAVETNEEATLRISDKVAIDAAPGKPGSATAVALRSGEPVTFEIEFNKPRREAELDDSISQLRILWRDDRGEWQPVPGEWMRHSRAQRMEAEMSLR